MRVTTERLLMSPAGFGIATATPVQRAICRVADGLPLEDLAAHPDVIRAFGGLEAIATLGGMVGTMPLSLYVVAGIRGGKSLLEAALAIRAAVTCNLDGIGPGEPPARVSVISLTRDLGQVVFDFIMGAMTTGEALRPLLVGDPLRTSLKIRHPTGRIVEIRVVAGSRAGSSVAARYSAGIVVDEGGKMLGQADGTINLDHLIHNAVGRMRPGAQMLIFGSPWAPRGPVYETTMKYHGKPCEHVVVVRAPGPTMNPYWWTPERIEQVRSSPDGTASYVTDVLGEFRDAESGWLAAPEVDGVTRVAPPMLPRMHGSTYVAAMDPATRRNAWTLVIATRVRDEATDRVRVVVARHRQWMPREGKPLQPGEVLAEIKEELDAYGLTEVYTDQWSADVLAALAEQIGVTVTEERGTPEEAVKRYQGFKTRVLQGDVELPPDREIKADLVSVKVKTTMRGLAFELPLTADGRHADYVPPLVLAVHIAGGEPTWIEAMTKWRARGGNW